MMDGDAYLRALEARVKTEGMVSIAKSYMRRVHLRHANQGDGQWAQLSEETKAKKRAEHKASEILQEDRILVHASREGGTGNLPPTVTDGGVVTGFSQTPHPNFKGSFAELAYKHTKIPRGRGRVILAMPTAEEFARFMKEMIFRLNLR